MDEDQADARGRHRRLYGPALIVGLLAGLGITVGSARPWVSVTISPPGLPTLQATASGTDLAPLASALGVVILAAFGVVIASRGRLRQAVGVAIVVASAIVLVSVLHPGSATDVLRSGLTAKGWTGGAFSTTSEPWRWLVLVSAMGAIVAGSLTAVFGAAWAVMGSRYDTPRAAVPVVDRPAEELSETDVWQAIDAGVDPTQTP